MASKNEGTSYKDKMERYSPPTNQGLNLERIQSVSSPRSIQQEVSQVLGAMAFTQKDEHPLQTLTPDRTRDEEREAINLPYSHEDAETLKNVSNDRITEKIQNDFKLLKDDKTIDTGINSEKVEGGYWATSTLRHFALFFSRKIDGPVLSVPREVADYMHNNLLSHFNEREVNYIKLHAEHYHKLQHENQEPSKQWKSDLHECIDDYSQSGLNDRIKQISKETIKKIKDAKHSSTGAMTNNSLKSGEHSAIIGNCEQLLVNCNNTSNVTKEAIKLKRQRTGFSNTSSLLETLNNLRELTDGNRGMLNKALEAINQEIKLKQT